MTIIELLTEKGFTEGVDYSLSGDELTVLEQIQHIPEVPAVTEELEVLDANGQSFDPAQFQQVELFPAIPAHDVSFFANIPSIELLYGELVAKEDTGLILGEFLRNKDIDSENDSCNMALFLAGDDSGFRFANIEAPTRKQLFDLIEPAKTRATTLNLKQNKIRAGKEAREICEKVLDLVAGYNLDRQLTLQQITQMQSTLSNAEAALRAGRPTYAKAFISAIVVDDVLVTQEMKDLCLELLEGY